MTFVASFLTHSTLRANYMINEINLRDVPCFKRSSFSFILSLSSCVIAGYDTAMGLRLSYAHRRNVAYVRIHSRARAGTSSSRFFPPNREVSAPPEASLPAYVLVLTIPSRRLKVARIATG